MSRRKRVELEQAVIAAARQYETCLEAENRVADGYQELLDAVRALDAYDVEPLTGSGAPWAAGSDTSRLAARLATPVQGSVRREIIAMLLLVGRGGATDRAMERKLRRSHQTVSSARNWLVNSGWVRDSGGRAIQSNGRKAVLWTLTDAARRTIREEWTLT